MIARLRDKRILRSGDHAQLLALAGILILTAVLRFHGLTTRGYIYWDEGKFALEGIRLHDLLSSSGPPGGKAIGTAKPTHALLIALADFVAGIHDYSALVVDAIASVVGVALVYFIARAIFGGIVGLLSALLLAVAPYDIVYARSALSESDGVAIFLAGVLVWVQWRNRPEKNGRALVTWGCTAEDGAGRHGRTRSTSGDSNAAQSSSMPLRGTTRDKRDAATSVWRRHVCGHTANAPLGRPRWRLHLLPINIAHRVSARLLYNGVQWRSWCRLLSGGLLGLAFTVNYRLLVYIAVVVGIDLLWDLRRVSLFRVSAGWLVGLAAAPLAWQIIDLIAQGFGTILFRSEITAAPTSYLQEALYQIHQGKQSVLRFEPGIYFSWYTERQGRLMMLLIALGALWVTMMAIRGRNTRMAAVPALVVVPYVIYVFAPFTVPRNLDATVPFASILTAVVVWELPRCAIMWLSATRGRLSITAPVLSAVLTLAIVLPMVAHDWPLGNLQSGFARSAAYLQSHGQQRALVTSEIMRFYLRAPDDRCTTLIMPQHRQSLAGAYQAGYHYAVVDRFNRGATRYIDLTMPKAARYLLGTRAPWGENLISSENGNETDPNDPDHYIDVFRLVPRLLPPGPRHNNLACSLTIP